MHNKVNILGIQVSSITLPELLKEFKDTYYNHECLWDDKRLKSVRDDIYIYKEHNFYLTLKNIYNYSKSLHHLQSTTRDNKSFFNPMSLYWGSITLDRRREIIVNRINNRIYNEILERNRGINLMTTDVFLNHYRNRDTRNNSIYSWFNLNIYFEKTYGITKEHMNLRVTYISWIYEQIRSRLNDIVFDR
jgi:hypothetical protein